MSTPHATTPSELGTADQLRLYRRATNYIAAAAIYLKDNVLLEEPLEHEHVKQRLLGHWGTVPGINLAYAGLNTLIRRDDAKILFVTGPGHGAPANLANLWLEGSLEAVRPEYTRDRAGLTKLIKGFSWPGGFPSHVAPIVPGVINEGGELGYCLAVSFGAALDNPDLIVACLVGDGEAETGPTATAWHSTKFLDPAGDGAVLPILHLNGYKIANPTIWHSMSDDELTKLFQGYGWAPRIVGGAVDELDERLLEALDWAHGEIRAIQGDARAGNRRERPGWPMIVLQSPKGWTGPKEVDGAPMEGTFRAHQVPAARAGSDAEHLRILEEWLRSYRPEELFDDGKPIAGVIDQCPPTEKSMGSNLHANGGRLYRPLKLPAVEEHAVEVSSPGEQQASALHQTGTYLRDVFRLNEEERNFRIVCPDEVASNRLGAVFEATKHQWQWPLPELDQPNHSTDGRVMEVLSEHNCFGWLQGYVLTGRHGVFPCYEAFISIVEGMVTQYAKFLKVSKDEAPWREPVASINLVLTSLGWRQDHNGYSHQAPGFINSMLNRKAETARVFLPPDANTMLVTMEECLESRNRVNLVISSKHPLPQWLSLEEAREHCRRGLSVWDWASSEGDPDVVLACCGAIPTIETLAAADIMRRDIPDVKVRVVNVTDLFSLAAPDAHFNGVPNEEFEKVFTSDRPVLFFFHGYPSAVHQLLHHRPNRDRFHVRGYDEEGTTTTPFELLAMNGVDRYALATEALRRADEAAAAALPTASGAFAVRAIPDAERQIADWEARRQELRAWVYENGNDPDVVRDWIWTS
jgi:xylulose-5-phosphate/fructose-6-phosphate phosphoketolase